MNYVIKIKAFNLVLILLVISLAWTFSCASKEEDLKIIKIHAGQTASTFKYMGDFDEEYIHHYMCQQPVCVIKNKKDGDIYIGVEGSSIWTNPKNGNIL